MKITKSELKKIIKEEVLRAAKIKSLNERKEQIQQEIETINERFSLFGKKDPPPRPMIQQRIASNNSEYEAVEINRTPDFTVYSVVKKGEMIPRFGGTKAKSISVSNPEGYVIINAPKEDGDEMERIKVDSIEAGLDYFQRLDDIKKRVDTEASAAYHRKFDRDLTTQ